MFGDLLDNSLDSVGVIELRGTTEANELASSLFKLPSHVSSMISKLQVYSIIVIILDRDLSFKYSR